jgi:hypothetical protein
VPTNITKLVAAAARLLPPRERSEVIAILSSTGRKVSSDVVDLYTITGGMPDGEDDAQWFSLWDLGRVVEENRRYRGDVLFFADFLIDSYLYCFRYESESRSSVCIEYGDGNPPKPIAESPDEFFRLLMEDPDRAEVG